MQEGNTNRINVLRIAGTIFMLVCFILSATTAFGGGKKKMEPLYDLSATQSLIPNVFKMRDEIYFLFPVLLNGTQYAATNSWNNAINILKFNRDKFSSDEYFKNAYDSVNLQPTVIPPIEDGVFGFGQIRGFAIFDLKKNKYKDLRLLPSINDTISRIAIADARRRHFIVDIERYPHKPKDAWDTRSIIRLYDLSSDEPRALKEMDLDRDYSWGLVDGKLFMYSANNLKVLTPDFETSHHPLIDTYKKYKNQIDILNIKINPVFPFALITDDRRPGYILTWGDRKNVNLTQIAIRGSWFDISPDGKWVVFESKQSGNTQTYLMPISEQYPYYVGTPMKMFEYAFDKYGSVWTTNPISFVGTYLKNLYRWELTKESYKSMMGDDFDKYPTFHDWIVAKDLGKLTKEKKQGLGK